MSKSKKEVRVSTSNHAIMAGRKNAAHDKKHVKRERKYPHAYRRVVSE